MRIIFLVLSLFSQLSAFAINHHSENLIIVTLDGMRWQEIFLGLDLKIVNQKKFTRNKKNLLENFGAAPFSSSRERLFPFIWKTVAKKGALLGNRKIGSKINVSNPYQFSYPGYNELFTGYPDPQVNSNENINNKNVNVFEFLRLQPSIANQIAVFATWETIPYILNRERSGLYINANQDEINFHAPSANILNNLQHLAPKHFEVRPDVLTFMAAKEYLKQYSPKVLYVSLGETDETAHLGYYDEYIESARATDQMLQDLWNTLQDINQYRNKTTLVITTDHGRGGLGKATWTEHGEEIPESKEIWMAFMGPDTASLGEVKGGEIIYQKQMAPTLAAFLGFEFKTVTDQVKPISCVLSN